MSARRRSPGLSQLSMWLGLLLHGALLVSVHLIEDDRWASVAALGSFAVCLASCLFLLRLNGLSPAVVYANVLAVFHLGLAVPWALGVASDPLPRWLLTHPLRPAMTLVMVAFAAYQVGATIAVWRWPGQRRPGKTAKTYHNKVLFDCGLVLTAVGIGALVWGIHTLGFDRLANATYFETYRLVRTYDPRFFISSLQIVPMGLYLAAASAPLNRLAIVLGVGGAWAGCIFLLGFRGFALVPILTLLAVLSKRGFRLPVSAYAVGVLIAMLAIPAVRVFRADPLAQRSLGGLLVASHPFEALQEMGGSLRPLVHTLELLDDESFRWGQSYWQAAKLVVPNLETEWQGDSYIPLEQLPLSHWVSKLAAPWSYQNYGGLGFSAVAEPYMNFGPAGVVVYFLLLGGALVWVDRIDASRPIRLAVWAMVLGPMLWTTRNTLAVFFRPADLLRGVVEILGSGVLTNGLQVERFEVAAAEYLEVEHCVAVSSCTSGLMLTARCLELQGEVILPSLTFFASGHALLWNNLRPVFADCDPETFQISVESAGPLLTSRTSAILGVHLYGCPAPVDELERMASRMGVPLIFDGAHAWGARWKSRGVASYGTATVYSLSPTKQVTAGEGGIVATGDRYLAEALRKARNYGKGASYDCDILGLNARTTEIQGLMGRLGLYGLDREISRRRALAAVYEAELEGVAGVQLQRPPDEAWHSRKDFPVVVRPEERATIEAALADEGVETRRYFDPPLHRQKLYRRFSTQPLPNTEAVSAGVVCLPLHGGMQRIDAERIARIIRAQL